MKIDFDTWNKLNIKISKINVNNNNPFEEYKEEDIDNFSKEQSKLVNLGILVGYLDILQTLGLVVQAKESGDFYIDPKCVEPMK